MTPMRGLRLSSKLDEIVVAIAVATRAASEIPHATLGIGYEHGSMGLSRFQSGYRSSCRKLYSCVDFKACLAPYGY